MIESRWKLTLDPTGTPRVLLDFGERIEGELPWQLEHAFEAIPLIDTDWQFLRDDGNALVSLDFSIFRIGADDVSARAAVMDGLVAYSTLPLAPLRVQLATSAGLVAGYYYQFAQCGVKSYAPQRAGEGMRAYHSHRYSLLCSGASKTTVP